MTGEKGSKQDIQELHTEACAQGRLHYLDPVTGYQVLTELAHFRRGHCCGSGCRHCPFDHENVPEDRRALLEMNKAGGGA